MKATNDEIRCTFTSRDGRRCRMLRSSDHPALCLHHLRQWLKRNDLAPLKPHSLAAPGALDNPWAVRRSLKHVVRELVNGRLTADQARALASLGRLLLVTTRRPRKRRIARAPRPKDVRQAM